MSTYTGGSPAPGLGLRERNKAERRARILAAARAVFAEKGYPDATTREIAARAEVGIGTLFAYAADKEALLALVVGDGLRAVGAAAFAAVGDGLPLLEGVLALLRPRYAFWASDPALGQHAVKATFAAQYRKPDAAGATEELEPPPQASLRPDLVALVERAQRTGEIEPDPPELVADVLLDIYLSESRDWIAAGGDDVDAGLARLASLLALVLRGVSRRARA